MEMTSRSMYTCLLARNEIALVREFALVFLIGGKVGLFKFVDLGLNSGIQSYTNFSISTVPAELKKVNLTVNDEEM